MNYRKLFEGITRDINSQLEAVCKISLFLGEVIETHDCITEPHSIKNSALSFFLQSIDKLSKMWKIETESRLKSSRSYSLSAIDPLCASTLLSQPTFTCLE